MKTIKKFRGVTLQQAKNGKLYARIPYRGVYPVKAGDRIPHQLGYYTVTTEDEKLLGDKP